MDRDAEIDDLYGLPLDEFTAARDDLAKRLRAAGDRDGAREVKTLRKPTVPAWAVNVATRRAPAKLEALFAATDQLARAQRRAASGVDAGTMHDLTTGHRAAVDAVVQEAAAALREAGTNPAAHLDEISATVLAGAVDAGARESLRDGRLVRPLDAPGFGALPALSVVDGGGDDDDDAETAAPEAAAPAAPNDSAQAEERAAAQRAWNDARTALREARAEREALERRAPMLDQKAEAAEHEAADLAAKAERAAATARAARTDAEEAAAQLEQSRAAEAAAEEEVARTAAAVEALDT
ncbi:MAG TPA: hypothetical protein VGV67_10165 [Solirubrobacteraceae bacterium]|nr:hypothetical protein [Solirubrobacteraceae bacterium]